jgi:transposase
MGSIVAAIVRIGLDIAKDVFQVHGVDRNEKPQLRKRLSRGKLLPFFAQLPPCEIGIEACGSAHHWARELTKLGHTVKLIAPQFVTPYRTKSKNDANDAEAICEAISRPKMKFVAVKSQEQQAVLMVHRAREMAMANRTAQVNQIRGLLAEFGIVVPQGVNKLREALPGILEDAENDVPVIARDVLTTLLNQFRTFDEQIAGYDRQIREIAAASEPARRLMQVESIGPLTATALVATMGDPKAYDGGRNFAASLGLTPLQDSSGNKKRIGHITCKGDGYVRKLLVLGAHSYLRTMGTKTDLKAAWAKGLAARRPTNVAAVALAAKHARIAWAMLAHGTEYRSAEAEVAAA